MQKQIRPRRSMLYMPGANARALEKARELPADGLIFDLEDAVLPDAKAAARETIRAALRAGGYGGRELILRVNGLATEWGEDDLRLAATLPIDGVLLPKVDSGDEISRAERLLRRASAPDHVAIWAMMETPLGILQSAEIAAASGRLAGLVMGTSDLVKDLRARHTPDRLPLAASLGLAVLAARANGLAIIDGVHLDLDDEAGFEAACRQGRDFGFDGKSLIHPKTIEAANRIFGPSADEIAAARRTIAGFEEARAAGKGVVLVDGRLVEQLHVDEARRVIALAGAIEFQS